MTARDVSSRLLLGVALVAVGCYDAPQPDCGFRCGPAGACPSDYSCGADNRCRLNGSSPTLVCATPDAAIPPDAYSPGIVFASPAAGSSASPSSTIRVGFDVDVTGITTSSFRVTQVAGAPVPGSVLYDPGTRTATFTGTEGLPPNTQITVMLTAEISDPLSGRPLMPTTYMFSTSADTEPPTVEFTTPSNGATGVSVGTNVSFTFSEQVTGIDISTVNLIETASTQPVAGSVTYNMTLRTATFNPLDQLVPNLGYSARLLSGITDVSGNALPTPQTSTFMTGPDSVAPNVRVTSPLNNAANVIVGTNIVVTFDEPVANVTTTTFQVNAGAVAGTITMSNGNRIATFDPTADLPAASTINVTLSSAITDTSSNLLNAAAFSFTTN
ncbi:MAG: Ig-like domain-containing protein [Myxococcota bacterium]|nr:Ig-like domain-containing protein [Myxococcota bacterium]